MEAQTLTPQQDQYEEKTIQKEITIKLQPSDFIELGKKAGELSETLQADREKAKEAISQIKANVKSAEKSLQEVLDQLAEGKITKSVEVLMRKNYNSGTVQYLYQNEIQEERPMTEAERQIGMWPEPADPEVLDEDEDEELVDSAEDIGEVIKEEQSRFKSI